MRRYCKSFSTESATAAPRLDDVLAIGAITCDEIDRRAHRVGRTLLGVHRPLDSCNFRLRHHRLCVLAAVIDLNSRRIVGWATAEHLRSELADEAIRMAITQRQPAAGLLHHSDRGVPYAADEYQVVLAAGGIRMSMSGVSDCYDNAVMESFFATLKTELVYQEQYATRAAARRSLFEYIEVFYNQRRRHSALDYLGPEEFERVA